MNRWLMRLAICGMLAGLGFWTYRILFPGPEQIIRKYLSEIARLASVKPNEGALTRLANSQKLTSFCTSDVQIALEVPGRSTQTLNGRDELLQAALATRSFMTNLKVKFLDVSVMVAEDGQSAITHLTAEANLPGENVPEVQELKILFRKIEGNWLITRAETVRTLH
jgi:hypothetical protein